MVLISNVDKMNFSTPVTDFGQTFTIKPQHNILALGSCFANVIGKKMQDNRFKILLNPFGTLYNPKSIFRILFLSIDLLEKKLDLDNLPQDIIFEREKNDWRSWFASSNIYGETREQCRKSLYNVLQKMVSYIKKLDVLMLTFGTNHYYYLKENKSGSNLCVANCHKMPSSFFGEAEMSLTDISKEFVDIIDRLRQIRPQIKVITTVSPYRYIKYGLHQSQISKASILLSIDIAMKQYKNLYYFPAYEIVNDELRDYRFYSKDMVHPSEVTEEYIWEKFCQYYLSKDLLSFIEEWKTILKMRAHIPTSEEKNLLLQENINQRIEKIKDKYPLMF